MQRIVESVSRLDAVAESHQYVIELHGELRSYAADVRD
jgi:hypothetical protein